jgi:hypothetical protein
MNTDPIKTAELLIVGYVKAWSMQELISHMGIVDHDALDVDQLHADIPFMPSELFSYRKGTPVRAIVEREWPKLANYLNANSSNPEKLLKAASQVVKLTYKGKRRVVVSNSERNELEKTKQSLRRATTEWAGSNRGRLSNLRGAWNVCKK